MSSDRTPSARTSQFRQALVATADLGPYVRRRPPLKLAIGSLTAFVLAGALTGGAIVAVNKVDPVILDAQSGAAGAAHSQVEMLGGTMLGKPIMRTGTGTQEISLGVMPAGATDLAEGFECIDAGRFVGFLDSKRYETYPDCEPDGASGTLTSISAGGAHAVTIQAPKSTRFTIWLSWAKIPKLAESPSQRQETSDGVVTRDEDLAAVNRYVGCMDGTGNSVGVFATSVVPGYSVSDLAVRDGSDHRCYVTEYRDVDIKWQLEVQAGQFGQTSIAACVNSPKTGIGTGPRAIVTPKGVLPDLTNCPWIG